MSDRIRVGIILRTVICATIAVFALGKPAAAQVPIDTIIFITDNVYEEERLENSFLFRAMNAVHVTTQLGVVQRELLFRVGEVYDTAITHETARNLRATGLFRSVSIDTTRVGGRLAVVVHTKDAWTLRMRLSVGFTAGEVKFTGGLSERNILGTGNLAEAIFTKDPDRTGVDLTGNIPRIGASRFGAGGTYTELSDGTVGSWSIGLPYHAFIEKWSLEFHGSVADARTLRFRTVNPEAPDTTFFWRKMKRTRAVASWAPIARPGKYLRLGGALELRDEGHVALQDTSLGVPDTTTVIFGPFVEFRDANYELVGYYNGLTQEEDLDLSTTVRLSAWIAPSAFGYDHDGFGPEIQFKTGTTIPHGYWRGSVEASALFNGAGLDSGQVRITSSIGIKPALRHVTFLYLEGGVQRNPAPGQELDLGLDVGMRSYGIHSFTGTRSIWGTLEHRFYAVDEIAGLFGIGLAAFLDYGGAWYADQDSRFGGDIGIGIRTGSSRSTIPRVGRIDVGYRFGDLTGNHLVFSIAQSVEY
jgi:hypothetical protein